MTFGMTGSPVTAALRRFVGQIVTEPTFRDVCMKSGKWFRAQENCFVAGWTTKHSDKKCQQFELDKF
jgi:hypothetical protein